MNILLTGATGFIGHYLAEKLLKEGHKLICTIRKTSNIEKLKELNIEFYETDLRERESLENLPDNIDIVYHLAAIVSFSSVSDKAFQDMLEANAKATENLFLAVIKKNPALKKFIYCSSLAALGFQRGVMVDNNTKAEPDTLYGQTKYEGEVIIDKLAKEYNIPLVVIRPSLVYGKNDFTSDFLSSVKIIKKGVFPIFGNGGNTMSPLIFVEDLAEIFVKFANSKKAGYFIAANDEKYTMNYFVETISQKLDRKFGAIKIPVWLGEMLILPIEILARILNKAAPLNRRRIKDLSVNRMFKDIHKDLDEAIDYHPNTNLKEGIDIAIDWYKENNLL